MKRLWRERGRAPGGPAMDSEEVEEAASPASGYYYTPQAGGHAGPCSVPQLRVLWSSGHIGPETMVWREGTSDWLSLDAAAELA